MVAIGLLFIATGLVGAWLWRRDEIWEARWFQRAASQMWPLGFVAILAGRVVTEQGRPPWIATSERVVVHVQGRLAALLERDLYPTVRVSGVHMVAEEGLEPPTRGL